MNNLLIFENLALLSLLVVGAPLLLSSCLLFTKNKLSDNAMIYLYAFSTGLLIILSTFGLMREGYEETETIITENFGEHSNNEIWMKVLIVGGGVLLGLIIAVLIKTLVFKMQNKKYQKNGLGHESKHGSCEVHDDSKCCVVNVEELIKKNGKLAAMFIISSHKFIDGISIGLLANSATTLFGFENIGILIIFIIHDLPITVVIFYMQRSNGVSKGKTMLYILLISIITVPFMFIGGYLGNTLQENINVAWIVPFLECLAGGVLLFTTIMEIVPEFIHNHHLCSKHWYYTVTWLCFGIMISIIMCLIHLHGDHHDHEEAHNIIETTNILKNSEMNLGTVFNLC